ncbi:MAG: hypothetical protein JSU70_22495 [Phycisphaerales bacterium]|nr:MAG: hypothetical protein JSU70_22495 [Phycisphaerales bacterium]
MDLTASPAFWVYLYPLSIASFVVSVAAIVIARVIQTRFVMAAAFVAMYTGVFALAFSLSEALEVTDQGLVLMPVILVLSVAVSVVANKLVKFYFLSGLISTLAIGGICTVISLPFSDHLGTTIDHIPICSARILNDSSSWLRFADGDVLECQNKRRRKEDGLMVWTKVALCQQANGKLPGSSAGMAGSVRMLASRS